MFSQNAFPRKRTRRFAKGSLAQRTRIVRRRIISVSLALMLGVILPTSGLFSISVSANNSAQPIPFAHDWTDTSFISTDDDWSGVPGIIGYRGDGLVGSTGVNPQTVLGSSTVVDVNSNLLNPNTFATGGVSEFEISNPVVALQGSGTARAPYIQLHLNTTGFSSINVSYNVRDIDGSVDNAVQAVALQFRVGSTGNFTNVPAGFVADATEGGTATKVTAVNATLPAVANNQPVLQVRMITTDAIGSDEWVGIDDISITGASAETPTNPTGIGVASPNSVLPGQTTTLTVSVTPGTNPTSTGLAVTANLTSIGGSSTQTLSDSGTDGDVSPGDNVFTSAATVVVGTTPGPKSLPFSITDAQSRSGNGSINLTVQSPPPPADHVVISQIYGGGGNASATYQNDYVELYNPSPNTFSLTGWSIQYAAATGTGWGTQLVPLAGPIAPGEYYLIKLASGGATGAPLADWNVEGTVNMSATSGKVALVNNTEGLTGASLACPSEDPNLVDLVGYGGSANCREGSANAPGGSNTTVVLRLGNGSIDTNQNGADFVAGAPNPRRTAVIIDAAPFVSATDTDSEPGESTPTPKDGSVAVFFSEPVDVSGNWFSINCANSGAHTAVVTGGPRNWVITPDVNFQNSEQCTIQVFAANVHDLDTDDSEPNTNFMQANYSNNFTVVAAAPAPYDSSIHLAMGNPSGAVADTNQPNNYLLEKPEFSLSFNRDRGGPNWVSWHLSDDWTGSLTRVDTFRPDPQLPAEWNRVNQLDYTGSGFDRGHMTPSADRLANLPLNQATFLMDNIVPQAPINNQQTWNNMEQALRNFTPANELYIVSGGAGIGGSGNNGFAETIAGGRITVPEHIWKVALIIPKGSDDISRVQCGSHTIAVIVPNTNAVSTDWTQYITSVDAVEQLTGYDFFSALPDAIENCVEAGTDGTNPPGTEGQAVTTDEDTPKVVTLTAAAPDANPLTYTIVSGPDHGDLSGTGANQTYTPDPNYFGPDSFTFKVSNGTSDSNTSTVNITVNSVNDAPVAVGDNYATDINTQLNVAAAGVLANDSDPVEQSGITAVLVSDVSHGDLTLNADGSFTYNPDAGFAGTDSFTYKANDGTDDSNIVTVSIDVNDGEAPVLDSSIAITNIWPPNHKFVNVGLVASATDNSGDPVTVQVVVYGDEDDATPTSEAVVNSPDAKNIAPGTLQLRSERVDSGDGRVYLIVITATDSAGNSSRNYHTVVVPRSNSKGNILSVNAQAAAAIAASQAANGAAPPNYYLIGDQ